MENSEQELEQVVLTRLLRLNATIHGIVFGLAGGSIIFIATLWLVIQGGPVVGPNLSLLGEFFIGYQVTYFGSVVGFFYGFVTGFLIGYFIARVYNRIVDLREGNPPK